MLAVGCRSSNARDGSETDASGYRDDTFQSDCYAWNHPKLFLIMLDAVTSGVTMSNGMPFCPQSAPDTVCASMIAR